MPYGLPWSEDFIHEISDSELRHEFVRDQVRVRLALLIRALREQEGRGWNQTELGDRMGKPQSTVSRIEDPDYGKLSLQTLFEVAEAFELPLWVDIPEWDEWLRRIKDIQRDKLYRKSFDADELVAKARSAKAGISAGEIVNFDGNYPNRGDSSKSAADPGRERKIDGIGYREKVVAG